MNKYVNIKNLFMCTIMFIGVLIFILLSVLHIHNIEIDIYIRIKTNRKFVLK